MWISLPGSGSHSPRPTPLAPPSRPKAGLLMRTLKISLVFWGMLFSVPALAANGDQSEEEQPPPKVKLGGADTRAPGPLTIAPTDIQLPPIGQPPTEDYVFDYHGFFR